MKIEITGRLYYNKETGKFTHIWRLNNLLLLNTNKSTNESKQKSKNTLRKIKKEVQHTRIYGHGKNSSKREVHSNKGIPQDIRKNSNKQPKFYLKELGKEERINLKFRI